MYILGNLLNFSFPNKYVLHRVDTTQPLPLRRQVVAELPVAAPSYMHSFIATPNYVVFVEYPLFWQIPSIITHTRILPALLWQPERGTRVRVVKMDHATGRGAVVQDMRCDPFFAYHWCVLRGSAL